LKIILDTNVLISASIFGGLSADIFTYCYERHTIYISDFILNEFHRILKEKLKVPEKKILFKVSSFKENLEYIKPKNAIPDICKDKDDNSICQLAEYVTADYIITGDKAFQEIQKFGNIKIVSPRDFWIEKSSHFH